MTRRDVAAMRLALEMLRLAYTGEYEVAHFHRVGAVDGAVDALRLANLHLLADALEACGVDRKTMRATVARAALYLRARLRAEAGDCGARITQHCRACHVVVDPYSRSCAHSLADGRCLVTARPLFRPHRVTWTRRITPLWEQAAQWWATHERPAR